MTEINNEIFTRTATDHILHNAMRDLQHGVVKHHYRHGTQRSQSLNRGPSLSRTDGTW